MRARGVIVTYHGRDEENLGNHGLERPLCTVPIPDVRQAHAKNMPVCHRFLLSGVFHTGVETCELLQLSSPCFAYLRFVLSVLDRMCWC